MVTWHARRYYQPYSHVTTLSDITAPSGYQSSGSHCMLMGAKTSASSNTLALAAIADANYIDDATALNSPRYTRGVYWHVTDGPWLLPPKAARTQRRVKRAG